MAYRGRCVGLVGGSQAGFTPGKHIVCLLPPDFAGPDPECANVWYRSVMNDALKRASARLEDIIKVGAELYATRRPGEMGPDYISVESYTSWCMTARTILSQLAPTGNHEREFKAITSKPLDWGGYPAKMVIQLGILRGLKDDLDGGHLASLVESGPKSPPAVSCTSTGIEPRSHSLASSREKQQKFGILDAPHLLRDDLDDPPGIFGRAVVFFDLDGFKAINQRFTERVVDQHVLPTIQRLIARTVDGLGLAYAEGGDEMIVLLPNATLSMGAAFADAIRCALHQHPIKVNDEVVCVTASFGVAAGFSGSDLADAANRAKNYAKESGKDCVVVVRDNVCEVWRERAPDANIGEHRSVGDNPVDRAAKLEGLLRNIGAVGTCLKKRRWARISQVAPPDLIEKWIDIVESLTSGDNAVEPLFVAMWKEARDLEMVPRIPALDGRIDLKGLTQVYIEKKAFWVCLKQQQPLSVGPGLVAREAELGWTDSAWERSHSLAGPLFELVWEVLKGQNGDKMVIDRLDLRWWAAAGGVVDAVSSVVFYWPAIEMPTFSAYERMAMKWNREYSQAVKFHKHAPASNNTADNLARWYVEYHHALWHRDWDWRDWTGIVSHLSDVIANSSNEPAYAEWIRALPLLAAPESGLSPEVASDILAGIKLDEAKRRELDELRLRRARECLPNREAEEVIATLDANYSDHPWVQQIKKR